jgi:sulfotransferase
MNNHKQKFSFVTGLPRSGSTVLCNILAQNPHFHCDAVTSGLVGLLSMVQENWEKSESFRAWPDIEAKKRVLKGIFYSYYGHSTQPTIIDKNRGWLNQAELLEMVLEERPKFLVTVRDMRAIMSSWEKMWRKNKALFRLTLPPEAQPTVESRVQHWGSSKDHTGRAYLNIQDALSRGYRDSMLFIDFDKLTEYPQIQMNRIYDFLELPRFQHDFKNIVQKNIEEDPVGWMRDLHVIKPQLIPLASDWEKILGSPANGLAESNKLWESFT